MPPSLYSISLLVALVGLILYLLVREPKPAEVGRLMFFAGLLAYLWKG